VFARPESSHLVVLVGSEQAILLTMVSNQRPTTVPRAVMPPRRKRRLPGVFAHRDYTLFWGGAFITNLGSWLQSVALGWLVLTLTNSTFLLGIVGFAQTIPVLLLGLLGGAIADRSDRRVVLIIAQGAAVVLVVLLTLLTWFNDVNVAAIIAFAVLTGSVSALSAPAWQAFIKDLVQPDQLRSAIALNSTRFNLSRIIGPAIGGWLLAQVGPAGCFATNAVSYLGVLGALFLIRTPKPKPAPYVPLTQALNDGLAYAWRDNSIRSLLFVTAAMAFFGFPYGSFMPAFARDVLNIGPKGLGTLLTAVGVGAIAGAFASSVRWVGRHPRGAMVAAEITFGAALCVFSLSVVLPVSLAALVVLGFAMITYLSVANSVLQMNVPDALRGRLMGIWVLVNTGVTPVGSLILGGSSAAFGISRSLAGSGIALVAAGVIAAWYWSRLPIATRRT